MSETPECDYGEEIEKTEHYFLRCCKFDDIRAELPDGAWNTETILKGDDQLDRETNELIQMTGQEYIVKTKRFDK